MKIVHMEMHNRHLKPKQGGYFSDKNSIISTNLASQSPPVLKPNSKIDEISPLAVLNPSCDSPAEKV